MKILILGDIHGRDCWKSIIEKEQPDQVIFLGDYVSTHDNISAKKQFENLLEILDYKEKNSDKVILLRGNHDLQHIVEDTWAACSGFFNDVYKKMIKIKDRFFNLTQWVYLIDGTNYLCSHAGVSAEWMEYCGIDNINQINSMPVDRLFGFLPCKMSDYYGTSPTQPPTWIRPHTLIECGVPGYVHIVGHTRTNGEVVKVQEGDITIFLCDCLPNHYLTVENNVFNIK